MTTNGIPLRRHNKGPPPPTPTKPKTPDLSRSFSNDAEDQIEPDMLDTSHMNFVDGRCSCCPYGYHIDLDFLRYMEDMNSSQLHNLKRIHRDKKKQRKSMEVYLRYLNDHGQASGPPPDVVYSTSESLTVNVMGGSDDLATQRILEEIDSSMEASLGEFEGGRRRNGDWVDSDMDSPGAPPRPPPPVYESRYQTEISLGKSDSFSSMDSQSTFSSEQMSPGPSKQQQQKRSHTTSAQLASSLAGIDLSSLPPHAHSSLREYLALSLQYMRELEEQVKMIPVLQVRISVLKEEKRLLMLQLKAKSNKVSMRSIGVGERTIAEQVDGLQGPRPAMRSVGCGDFSTQEDTLLLYSEGKHATVKVYEREIHTSENIHSTDREVRTVFLGQSSPTSPLSPSGLALQRPKIPPMVPTRRSRSIGVGDGDVFNLDESSLHVHEKELRTVFISDGDGRSKPATRNVGILCKVPVREVGVNYMADPNRDVAIGVNEVGFDGSVSLVADGELGGASHTTTVYNTLQQIQMAALHTRHIHIEEGMLAAIIDEKLRKVVHSQQTQTDFGSVHCGVQVQIAGATRSIGCGDDEISVVVRPVVDTKNAAVDARPMTMSRSSATEKQYTIDVGMNTSAQSGLTVSKATNTQCVITYPATTNTETVTTAQSKACETDLQVFMSMNALRSSSTNTALVQNSNAETNTEYGKRLDSQEFDLSIQFANQGTSADKPKYTWDRGSNPQEVKFYEKGVNTVSEVKFHKGVMTDHLQNVISRSVNTVQPRVYSKGVGEDTVTDSPLSPVTHSSETVVVKRVTECENCKAKGSSSQQSRWTGSLDIPTETSAQEGFIASTSSSVTKQVKSSSPSRSSYSSNVLVQQHGQPGKPISLGSAGEDLIQLTATESSVTCQSGKQVHGQAGKSVSLGSGGEELVQVTAANESSLTSQTGAQQHGQPGQSASSWAAGEDLVQVTATESRTSQSGALKYGQPGKSVSLSSGGEGSVHQVTASESLTGQSDTRQHGHPGQFVSGWSAGEDRLQVAAQSGGGKSESVTYSTAAGGTQMRVIEHVETSYVGQTPVKRSSNVVMHDSSKGEGRSKIASLRLDTPTTHFLQGGSGQRQVTSSHTFVRTVNGKVVEERSTTSSTGGKTLMPSLLDSELSRDHFGSEGAVDGSHFTEQRSSITSSQSSDHTDSGTPSPNGTLRSIMKKATIEKPKVKKEISFSEDVIGGRSPSSTEPEEAEEEEDNEEEEEQEYLEEEHEEELAEELENDDEEEEEGGESEESYDEGSYDGQQGRIVYTGKDVVEEEVETVPHPPLYDQNIRQVHDMSADMQNACQVYSQWLDDSTQVNSKQVNSALNIIQKEWFRVSSHKLSDTGRVEDYLNVFNNFSKQLLTHIVNMADANGNTALHYAVSHCNMDIVSLLLDSPGIDVNKQNRAGYTAIMLASLTQLQTERERQIVRRLFQIGDVNAQAKEAGQTALMLAVSHGKHEMLKLLIEAGAKINTQDEDGSTALMCAAEHGYTDIVKLLLAQPGCDATIKDNDGSSALTIAMEKGHRDISVILYAHTNLKPTSPHFGRHKVKKRGSRSSSNSSINSQN